MRTYSLTIWTSEGKIILPRVNVAEEIAASEARLQELFEELSAIHAREVTGQCVEDFEYEEVMETKNG